MLKFLSTFLGGKGDRTFCSSGRSNFFESITAVLSSRNKKAVNSAEQTD